MHSRAVCVLTLCIVFLQLIIDPVCMLTCCPKLLHSFVYKVPRLGAQLLTPLGLMDIARYVCSRDLIIAEVLTALSLHSVVNGHTFDRGVIKRDVYKTVPYIIYILYNKTVPYIHI